VVVAVVVVAAPDFVAEPDDDHDVGTDVVVIVVLLVPLVTVKVITVAGVDTLEAGVLETGVLPLLLLPATEEADTADEDAGFCTVLNVVATGTDTAADVVMVAVVVVDKTVFGKTLAMLETEVPLTVAVDITAAGELVDKIAVVERIDEDALEVLDTALPPTTPPRTVESSGCVVAEVGVEVGVLLVTILCAAVLRLAMARMVDCVVTTADEAATTEARVEAETTAEVEVDTAVESEDAEELAPTARPPPASSPRLCVSVSTAEALALEAGMALEGVASGVVDTMESIEDNSEAEELELALEVDTKMVGRTPTRLADVVAAVVAAVVGAVVVGLEGCDAKIGRTVVTAPAASEVMVARMVVLDPGSVVLEIVGTSDVDGVVDASEAPRSRIVLTAPTSVLVAWTGTETIVLVDPARMLSVLKLTATELRVEIVVGSTEVSGARLTIAVGVTSSSTFDVNAPSSRVELERTRVGKIELGKTEVGKTELIPTSGNELGRIGVGKTELVNATAEVGKAEVRAPSSRIEVGKTELASIELSGKLVVSTPRSRIELGRVELGRTEVVSASSDKSEVRTLPSPSVDVEAGILLGSAAASTLSIGVEAAAAAVIEEGAALVVNGVVLLSTRQLAAGKLHVHILPNHHHRTSTIPTHLIVISLHLIATLTRCEQHWQQRRPLNQQRT